MGTIADKLSYLNETKTQFREKLNRLGADILENATFRSYLVYLNNLYNGLFNLTDMSENGIIGRTNQDDTPSPSTPQEIKDLSGNLTYSVIGKNLFDKNNLDTTNGFLNKTNGTITSNNAFRVSGYIDVSSFSQITISGNSGGNEDNCFYDENKNYISYFGTSTNSSVTASVPNNAKYLRVTVKATNLDIYQVEEGNEATTYEQHISKRDFTISLKSKNFFNDILYNTQVGSNGGITSSTTRVANVQVGGTSMTYVPKGTYTLSIENLDYCSVLTKQGSIIIDNFATSWHELPYTFTTTQDAYLYFTGKKSNDSTISPSDYSPQVEEGNQATTYEPHYDIHLDKIDIYEDKIYAKDNKFYLHKEIDRLDIASSYNRLMTNYSNIEYIEINKPTNFLGYDSYDMIEIKSNKAIWMATATSGWDNAQNIGKISGNANKPCWWMGFTKGTGLDNIKIALNGCYIDYPLNTSTTIEITSALYPTLCNQLKEIQDYLIKYKSKYELILNCDKPNIEY